MSGKVTIVNIHYLEKVRTSENWKILKSNKELLK